MFARYLNALAGVWLLIAAWVLPGAPGQARASELLTGLAILTFALLARRVSHLRFINTGLGAWLAASPFVLAYTGFRASTVNDVLVGIFVMGMSILPNFKRVEGPRRMVTP